MIKLYVIRINMKLVAVHQIKCVNAAKIQILVVQLRLHLHAVEKISSAVQNHHNRGAALLYKNVEIILESAIQNTFVKTMLQSVLEIKGKPAVALIKIALVADLPINAVVMGMILGVAIKISCVAINIMNVLDQLNVETDLLAKLENDAVVHQKMNAIVVDIEKFVAVD